MSRLTNDDVMQLGVAHDVIQLGVAHAVTDRQSTVILVCMRAER